METKMVKRMRRHLKRNPSQPNININITNTGRILKSIKIGANNIVLSVRTKNRTQNCQIDLHSIVSHTRRSFQILCQLDFLYFLFIVHFLHCVFVCARVCLCNKISDENARDCSMLSFLLVVSVSSVFISIWNRTPKKNFSARKQNHHTFRSCLNRYASSHSFGLWKRKR